MLSTTFQTAAIAVLSFSSLITARAVPFNIIVETPTQPSILPWFLSAAGTVSSKASDAATYYLSDTKPFGELFVDGTPVGTGSGTTGAVFKGFKGKDSINTEFSIVDNHVVWKNERFVEAENGTATYALGLDGKGTVWAYFGGLHTEDTIPAKLLVKYKN